MKQKIKAIYTTLIYKFLIDKNLISKPYFFVESKEGKRYRVFTTIKNYELLMSKLEDIKLNSQSLNLKFKGVVINENVIETDKNDIHLEVINEKTLVLK